MTKIESYKLCKNNLYIFFFMSKYYKDSLELAIDIVFKIINQEILTVTVTSLKANN